MKPLPGGFTRANSDASSLGASARRGSSANLLRMSFAALQNRKWIDFVKQTHLCRDIVKKIGV
jgi:hypothetical protein